MCKFVKLFFTVRTTQIYLQINRYKANVIQMCSKKFVKLQRKFDIIHLFHASIIFPWWFQTKKILEIQFPNYCLYKWNFKTSDNNLELWWFFDFFCIIKIAIRYDKNFWENIDQSVTTVILEGLLIIIISNLIGCNFSIRFFKRSKLYSINWG